jgi:chemotaxis protein MotA
MKMKSTIVGLIGATVISYYAVYTTANDKLIYLNLAGLIIVVGGTFCAGILTFGLQELVRIFTLMIKVFSKNTWEPVQVIESIIKISHETQNDKNFSKYLNDKKLHPFLSDGLRLVANEFNKDQVEKIMSSAMIERKKLLFHQVEIVKTLAKHPPAFGMIGTIIGLVAILENLGTEGGVGRMGPAMAVALITTLYGLFMANYLLIPMSDNLSHRLSYDLNVRKIIVKGLALLQEGHDPIFVQEMLLAYIPPGSRLSFDGKK